MTLNIFVIQVPLSMLRGGRGGGAMQNGEEQGLIVKGRQRDTTFNLKATFVSVYHNGNCGQSE